MGHGRPCTLTRPVCVSGLPGGARPRGGCSRRARPLCRGQGGENYDPWHERFAYTGFPGLAVDLEEHRGLFHLTFFGRGQGVFGASNASPEVARWQARHPDATPKSILPRHQYWYGWGWTVRARFELRIEPFRLEGALRYLAMDSQEGFDRNEALVTFDADGYGQLLELGLEARVDIEGLVAVRARWLHQARYSRLDEVETTRALDRFELSIGAGFF